MVHRGGGGHPAQPSTAFVGLQTLKPIFHCNAKPFMLGPGVG